MSHFLYQIEGSLAFCMFFQLKFLKCQCCCPFSYTGGLGFLPAETYYFNVILTPFYTQEFSKVKYIGGYF